MKVRLLLIGSFNGTQDEGLAQLSKLYSIHFNSGYNVKTLGTYEVLKPKSVINILFFRPQIIHYITGPTLRSLTILRILKILLLGRVRTVASATRPFFLDKEKKWIKLLKPDLILTQAEKWNIVFKQVGIKTKFLSNPINCKKNRKLDLEKNELREKYNLPQGGKLILHVGHIRPNRNVEFFSKIQKELTEKNIQIVVVGSTHFPADENLLNKLQQTGCIVLDHYIENITEIYNACDYYIFPVLGLAKNYYPKTYDEVGVIDMPLSVLEALACELPVISTEIDAVEKLISNKGESPLTFFDGSVSSFLDALNNVEGNTNPFEFETIKTKIDQDMLLNEIEKTYLSLLD